jgi:hypothetical protein
MSHKFVSSKRVVTGLLTAPQAAPETCGQWFRRGRETHADLERLALTKRTCVACGASLLALFAFGLESIVQAPLALAQSTSSFSMRKADARVKRTPTPEYFSLYAHLSRIFAVEVDAPEARDQALHYEWRLDGNLISTKEVFELKDQPEGRHTVEVSVTGTNSFRLAQRWTVEVRKKKVGVDPDDPSERWPANITSTVDNVVTDLSTRQITVMGTVRNPTPRVVDNFAAWVTALDKNHAPIARRILVVPQPQSLAPGEVASFSIIMANNDKIDGFRVQPIVPMMQEEGAL